MTDEEYYECSRALEVEKQAFLKANPDFMPDGDFWDDHSCRVFADDSGYCQWCGDVVYGSSAYRELYGGE